MPPMVLPVPSLAALNTMSLQRAALAYAAQGLPVFPLVPRDKVPRVARGFYRATTHAAQIQDWWSAWPDANIGIATGPPSGWWVLDIDPRHGGFRSLEALEGQARARGATVPLSQTLRQWTGGGGIHLVYQMPRTPGSDPPNGTFAGYHGIELKKGGGYIVASPSRHPSGFVYQWQQDTIPQCFPTALLALWAEDRQRAFSRALASTAAPTRRREARESDLAREGDPEYWLHAALRHAAPGSRHRYAYFLAIKLVSVVGCSFEEAAFWMREYVARVIQLSADPYDLDDALRCLRDAWGTYGP